MKNALGKLIDLIIRVTLFARDNISTPDMLGVSASEVSRSRGGKDSAKVCGLVALEDCDAGARTLLQCYCASVSLELH